MASNMVTKNGDTTISSWRRQLRRGELKASKASITFEGTENGGVILQEETMVLHGRWTYFEPNSRGGGEESFQDEPCDDDDGGVAGEGNKYINKQKTRLEPGKKS